MKKWLSIGIGIVIVIAGGFLGWNKFFKDDTAQGPNLTVDDLRPQMTMEVEKSSLEKTIAATGEVESVESQELYFKTKGTIQKINIEEGDEVEAGEVLMEISDTEQQLSYLQAKNKYERAKIDGTPAEIKEAELELQLAEDDLEDTKLKAPFSGVVNEITVEEDSYTELELDKAVAKIIDDSSYQVEISVNESESRQIEEGQQARVSLDALAGEEFAGAVTDVGANAQSESGVVTLPVTVSILETPEFIRPGFTADVEVIVDSTAEQIVIPITAVFSSEQTEKVVKIKEDSLQPVEVETGLTNDGQIAVKSGLKPGDKILINAVKFMQSQNQSEKDGMPRGSGRMMR
ncbi:MAG: efflux RND transporter periplasmic adaptor subunit [Halanaerobacter sp.]